MMSSWVLLLLGGLTIGGILCLSTPKDGRGSGDSGSAFVEGTIIGIARDHPKQHNVVFVNTTDPNTTQRWPPGKWNVVDCSEIVPEGTKAVALSSLLLITHGSLSEVANLTLAVRRHGSTVDNGGDYHAQTTESHPKGGQRTADTIWVAVSEDRKFEIFWTKTSEVPYPEGSAYGIHMNLFGYMR